jgi:hypothetical protein
MRNGELEVEGAEEKAAHLSVSSLVVSKRADRAAKGRCPIPPSPFTAKLAAERAAAERSCVLAANRAGLGGPGPPTRMPSGDTPTPAPSLKAAAIYKP